MNRLCARGYALFIFLPVACAAPGFRCGGGKPVSIAAINIHHVDPDASIRRSGRSDGNREIVEGVC